MRFLLGRLSVNASSNGQVLRLENLPADIGCRDGADGAVTVGGPNPQRVGLLGNRKIPKSRVEMSMVFFSYLDSMVYVAISLRNCSFEFWGGRIDGTSHKISGRDFWHWGLIMRRAHPKGLNLKLPRGFTVWKQIAKNAMLVKVKMIRRGFLEVSSAEIWSPSFDFHQKKPVADLKCQVLDVKSGPYTGHLQHARHWGTSVIADIRGWKSKLERCKTCWFWMHKKSKESTDVSKAPVLSVLGM